MIRGAGWLPLWPLWAYLPPLSRGDLDLDLDLVDDALMVMVLVVVLS